MLISKYFSWKILLVIFETIFMIQNTCLCSSNGHYQWTSFNHLPFMYFKIMSCPIFWFFTSISTKCRVMIHGSLQLMMISYIFWYAIPQSKKYIKRYNHDIDRLHLLFQVGGWALPQRDLIVRPDDFLARIDVLNKQENSGHPEF